jgi:hypothetical protein
LKRTETGRDRKRHSLRSQKQSLRRPAALVTNVITPTFEGDLSARDQQPGMASPLDLTGR